MNPLALFFLCYALGGIVVLVGLELLRQHAVSRFWRDIPSPWLDFFWDMRESMPAGFIVALWPGLVLFPIVTLICRRVDIDG